MEWVRWKLKTKRGGKEKGDAVLPLQLPQHHRKKEERVPTEICSPPNYAAVAIGWKLTAIGQWSAVVSTEPAIVKDTKDETTSLLCVKHSFPNLRKFIKDLQARTNYINLQASLSFSQLTVE